MSLLVRQSEALWGEMFLREKNLANNKNAKKGETFSVKMIKG